MRSSFVGEQYRKIIALASVILLALLLSGCGLSWPFPQPAPDPKLPDAQQILRPLASGPNAGEVDTLDPGQMQFDFDSDVARLIFPQLVTLDEKQRPIDWAAESHQISADGLTYIFHLHHGMTWSDGTPIDATTFAYSINRALDPCLESGAAQRLYAIKGAEAFNSDVCPVGAIKSTATLIGSSIQTPDPLTLRLTLAYPAGYFLAELTWPTSYAVPQALIERYGVKWTDHLTDNGPFGGNLFLLTSWTYARTALDGIGRMTFERNERFWGKKPLLRRIEYMLYKDASAEWSDFALGKGDVGIPDSAAAITATRTLPGVIVQQTPGLALSFLAINWKLAPFDDVRVRQALSLALDRQAIEHDIYLDTSQPTIHLVPEGMPGYNPDLTDVAGRKGKDTLSPDVEVARRLISSYAADKCEGKLALCAPIVLSVGNGSALFLQLGRALQQQWQQAFTGWNISIQALDGDANINRRLHGHLQLWSDGWKAEYPDPQDFLSHLWTTRAEYNVSAVSNAQVDALLAQADSMTDLTARVPLYQQAEQLLVNQGAAVPLTQPVVRSAVRSRVVGWRVAPTGVTPFELWQPAPTGVTPLGVWQTAYIRR
jgi:peptide/nickel transport system substrate-binding protein/oligopeptide transport system substrate-binding protein